MIYRLHPSIASLAAQVSVQAHGPSRISRPDSVRASESAMLGEAMARHLAFPHRSEEHTSELQSLMRISYAVFCLKKKKSHNITSEDRITRPNKTEKVTPVLLTNNAPSVIAVT